MWKAEGSNIPFNTMIEMLNALCLNKLMLWSLPETGMTQSGLRLEPVATAMPSLSNYQYSSRSPALGSAYTCSWAATSQSAMRSRGSMDYKLAITDAKVCRCLDASLCVFAHDRFRQNKKDALEKTRAEERAAQPLLGLLSANTVVCKPDDVDSLTCVLVTERTLGGATAHVCLGGGTV